MLKRHRFLIFALTLCALSIGILIGTLIDSDVRAVPRVAAPGATPLVIPDPVQLSNAFTTLAQRLEPAVVNIATTKGGTRGRAGRNRPPGEDDDDLFRKFFEGPFGGNRNPFESASIGSGVIVDRSGYVITNWHVVEEASEILVKLHGDRKEYPAELIGSDFETDIAVIKIEPGKDLPAAPIGNSDAVQVGDWVVAIGSPFGLEATVTAGIVSAKQRELADAQAFQRFLQTDAAINPGNSGGPLLNIRGEVIGINTAIASNSGRYQGVGFALPVNTAVEVYNQIIRSGKVTRGSIGITLNRADDPEVLAAYGAKAGVIVAGVYSSGPADRAGIQVDDVILEIAGKPIPDGSALIEQVASLEVGSEVPVVLLRDRQRMTKKVLIGDRTKMFADRGRPVRSLPPGDREDPEAEPGEINLGISIQNLTPEKAKEWGFPEETGVLITRVERGSFADEIGLRQNDVIVSAGGSPMKTIEDVRAFREGLKPGDAVAFRVFRRLGGRQGASNWSRFFAAGTLPEEP